MVGAVAAGKRFGRALGLKGRSYDRAYEERAGRKAREGRK